VSETADAKIITSVAEGTEGDVDRAVGAARKAFDNSWGLKVPGSKRGEYLNNLADLMAHHLDELAAIEALNNGKTFHTAQKMDLELAVRTIRYYAGWADKIHGQVIETREDQLVYTRHEPFGVVGQIVPSSFPRAGLDFRLVDGCMSLTRCRQCSLWLGSSAPRSPRGTASC
jgi:aldehyde dehydrogenase (NAD+)